MRNARVAAWLSMGLAVLTVQSAVASAASKLAIFPIDMSFPQSEEDFYSGKRDQVPMSNDGLPWRATSFKS